MDWSSITGRGKGYKTGSGGGGGQVKFYPSTKRGRGSEKVLAIRKKGAQKVLE